MHLVCPDCHHPIELVIPAPAAVVCPSCGSTVRVDAEGSTIRSGLPDGPRQVGRFTLLQAVGRGSFGTVYKARDGSLDRVVALKLPRAGNLPADGAERDRFLREARSAAQLRHPSIVSVHEVGDEGGLPYLVSDFVEGVTLAELLSGQRLTPRESAQLLADVADALHFAHAKGVVHRDVKPSNVMLGADGRPLVMDFGLAKRDAGEITMTLEGQVLGTPAYMAPEQARGEGHRADGRADVYSLGVMLYQMLTGELPFRGTTRMLLHQVLHDDPRPPRRLNDAIPRDLETVCLKAMAKEPGRRYQTAGALADDLRRLLGGKPVVARPVGRLARGWRWCGRNRAVATLLAALVLVTLTGLVSFAWAYGVAARRLAEVEEANRRRVRTQVEGLHTAAAPAVPDLLRALDAQHAEALPHLRALWAEGGDQPGRMRFALALLPDDPSLRDDVAAAMLAADDPREMLLLLDGLKPFAADLKEGLWQRAGDQSTAAAARFRALVALAALDPADARWKEAGRPAVEQLLQANSLYLGDWTEALRPASAALVGPLGDVFRGKVQADQRQVAAAVLADYARDDPAALADLAADSDPQQFALLSPPLERHRERAAELLCQTLARRTPEGAPEADRIALARRQAGAAAALLRLGAAEAAWPVLRHTPTPDARSYLVRDLAPRGVEARALVRRLDEETDASARRALILALGEYTAEQLPAEARAVLVPKLLNWYRHDPDAGLHGAIDWLVRQGKEGPVSRKLDWGQAAALAAIDKELAGKPPAAGRGWYVAPGGFTMAVVPGPVEFWMGSPPGEAGRQEYETRHRRRIGRSFAVAAKAVTVAEFKAFLRTKPPGVAANYAETYSPEAECPFNAEDWYAAAKYCRWLGEREGVAEDQMCYPAMKDIKEGMKPYPDHLGRTGYRLPTEAEWEYACRSGAETAYYYGGAVELLPRYGWYIRNSANRSWPVGQKRPNDLGLFDVHGNAWTWCQEGAGNYPPGTAAEPAGDKEDMRDIKDDLKRVVRGGASSYVATEARSAHRDGGRPSSRNGSVGLRVARTCR